MSYPKLNEIKNTGITVEAYYKQDFSQYLMSFHQHDYFEIMFIESGKCKIEIQNKQEKIESFEFTKNDFILIDSNVLHKLFVEPNSHCNIYNIELAICNLQNAQSFKIDVSKILANCDGLLSLISRFNYAKCIDTHFVKNTILRIQNTHELLKNKESGSNNALLQLLICELFLEIDKCCSISNQFCNFHLEKIYNFINENYQDDLTIESAAAYLKIHPSYIHKLFKENTTTTFHQFLNSFRVEKSIDLLQKNKLSILDVAIDVGFSNRQTYYNAFFKIYKTSPQKYRNKIVKQAKWVCSEDYKSKYVL